MGEVRRSRRHPRYWVLRLLGWAALAVALAVVVGPCARGIGTFRRASTAYHPDLAEVAALAYLSFPSDARLVDSHCADWMGIMLAARVELPAVEVESFVSQPRLEGDWSSTERFVGAIGLPQSASWWHPETVQHFRSVRITGKRPLRWDPSELVQESTCALVDLDDSGRATVYLTWTYDG